jgi:hypothetical protein
MPAIYPIVEGHGEARAVPELLRRIASEICRVGTRVLPAHRVPRGRMMAEGFTDLERAVELGRRKIAATGEPGAVLVLLDADDDCPAELGPSLLRRITRPDLPIAVVLAKREYEAWFLAAARSLGRKLGRDDLRPPADPEAVRDAKAHLVRHILGPGAVYSETVDQVRLTAALDLAEARAAPSFDKLCRDLCRLLGAAPAVPG